MKTQSMVSRAKINLSLSVLGKREDGYHDIESVMQTVEFGDVVTVTHTKEPGIRIQSSHPELPIDEGNIAYRAAKLMQENYEIPGGFTIFLDKRIPVAAGLAGGSTNAAAVMHLINHLCDLSLTKEQLSELGVTLGADVPFCLYGGAALCRGIGEQITPIQGLRNCHILLVNPGVGVSTAMIYQAIDSAPAVDKADTEKLLSGLLEQNLSMAFSEMKNMMEPVARGICPEISGLLEKLQEAGADHVMMSGSGATCVGFFVNKPDEEKLKDLFGKDFVALTVPGAIG